MSVPRKRRRLRAAAIAAVPTAAVSCLAVASPAVASSHPHHAAHHPATASHPPAKAVTPAAKAVTHHGHPAKHVARKPHAAAGHVRHLTVGRVHYRKGAHRSDPEITVNIGGDRPGSANEPDGVQGVWFRATGVTDSADTAVCETNAQGTCTINVTSAIPQQYTVGPDTTHAPPAGWFANPTLGVYNGTSVPPTNPGTTYDTVTTAVLQPNAGAVVPVASDTTALTSRGNRIAYSRTDTPEPKECGLRVGLLVDLSSSITAAGVLNEYLRAGQDFVTALQGTPSEIAVHTFGTNSPATSSATADNSNASLAPVATEGEADAVRAKIRQLAVVGTQYTNWDAGLHSFTASGEHYDVVIVLTDGDPTRYGRPDAVSQPGGATAVRTRFLDVENGIFSANALKATTGHSVAHPALLAVGITTGAPVSPGSRDNLRAISGPTEGENYFTTDFADLSGVLRSLAREQCEGTVSVVKHIVPHDGTINDAHPGGPDWSFTSTHPAETRETDDTSSVNFATSDEQPTTITAHERDGYTFLHNDTHCHVPGSDTPVNYTPHANGVTVTPLLNDPVTCDVYNRAPAPRPAISIVKSAFPTQFGVAGEKLTYTFAVKNTGQTPLHNIHVEDSLFGHIVCPRNELGVDESMECEYIHYTTEEDVERGSIHNTVRVTGEDPAGEPVEDDSQFTVDHVTGPHIQLEKVAFPTQYGAVGEVITYTYRVVNTGTATLHDVTLNDSRLGGVTCPSTVLEPGHEMDCTGHHTITADDIAAGRIHNVATVSGHDPETGRTVTDTDDATVTHHAGPGLQIQKEASPVRFTGAGQTIHYTYRVANTGNVTVHNLSVYDSKVGMITSCDATTLRPGEETTCRATYTTTQADAERGYVPNFAYARGVKPDGTPLTSGPSEAIVTGPQEVPVTG